MGKLFGVDVVSIVNKNIAPGLRPGVLTRFGSTERGDDLTAGRGKSPPTDFTCRGIWIDYMPDKIDGTLIVKGDKKALLLQLATKPQPEDTVTIDGESLVVVRIESSDPAGATFTVQCRDRQLAVAS